MWFSLTVFVIVINLHSQINCSAQLTRSDDKGPIWSVTTNNSNVNCSTQDACSDIKGPSINSITDKSVKISLSSNTVIIDKIEYWHINYLGCVKNESSGTVKVLTKIPNIIDSLIPFSNYGIKIAYFYCGVACIKEMTFNTTESATLSTQEAPAISNWNTETEAFVNIKWQCKNLRGPISRNIHIVCAAHSCVGESINYSKNETLLTTDLNFGINGQTTYILKLKYQRGEDSRSMEQTIAINLQKPHKVRNITAYNINETSISLKWLPPHPLTGDIELYEIRYYRGFDDEEEVTVDGSSYCEIWKEYICATINNSSFLNRTYNFEIRAKNRHIQQFGNYRLFGLPFTWSRVPSEPLNINYTWDGVDTLIINWQHPDIPNGPILQFFIEVNRDIIWTYNVTKQNLNYSLKKNVRDLDLISRKLIIEIEAANENGNSTKGINLLDKPHFSAPLMLENITDSTFDIQFPTVYDVDGDISKLYVIMTDLNATIKRDAFHTREVELFDEIGVGGNNSWIAGEFELRNITKLSIGHNSKSVSELDNTWIFIDRNLERNHSYNVTFLLCDIYTGIGDTYTLYTYYSMTFKTSAVGKTQPVILQYLWSLIFVFVLLIILWIIIVKQRRRNKYFGLCIRHDRVSNIYTVPLKLRTKDKIDIYDKIVFDDREFIKSVKVQELDVYIKESIENDELTRQYKLLPQGPIKLYNDGSQLPNRAKNRYPDLVAYDATRVQLEIIDEDPFSNYINANYIDGYNSQKAYIATQTPTDNTYSDFWRMVWQENVKYIIIASDLNEEEKEKSSGIYWPDINEELVFGDITVLYSNTEVMANYEIRHFSLSCENQERMVQQLHFFSMPDYSRVPLYIHSLASFIKKILSISEESSPIVVHCSDGISYTGITILCDICLRMAISEGQTDVLFQLYKLRKQRINMVSSLEQFKVVHFVLLRILECLKIPTETGIICDKSMERTVENILTTKIEQQMKYLEDSSWQDAAMREIDFLYDSIRSNDSPDLEEPSNSQGYRYSTIGDKTLYISTTIVDSFSTPSKFIVTCKPLNATLGVFWQFIFDKRINVVLCLNKLSLIADFKETFNPSPTLDVRCVNHQVNEHFQMYTLYANESTNESNKIKVNIIHITEWSSDANHPEHPNSLIAAYEEMNRLGKTGRPILITCHDGIQACGLFVAMCFLIEKIKAEHICDVCLAVKSVRQSRKEYVRKIEQYAFLYLCALEYVRKFKMYSNFDSSMNESNRLEENGKALTQNPQDDIIY